MKKRLRSIQLFTKLNIQLKKILKILGPGFITGASDDDPSGIGTYAQTGALFGHQQLWTALFSFPLMAAIQEMCGRIGLVTGKGLAGVIKKNYSKWLLYFCISLLILANTINIGADIGAMASAGQLLLGLPFFFLIVGITTLTLLLQIFIPYHFYARYLKYLTFSLLAYIVAAFVIKEDWTSILHATLVPAILLSKEFLWNIVAIFGTTISPYLFFWQASEEVEEEVEKKELRSMGAGVPQFNHQDIKNLRLDTIVGMLFSNIIMFFIIITTGSTLFVHGIHNIQTASQAAEALRPLAGNFAYILFSLGIIGTGLLAVPILAGSASYALSETLGFKEGLYRKFRQARGFYGIIILVTLMGVFVNFLGIPPFKLLYYTDILNGLCAPFLLFMILHITNNQKIMGAYTNGKLSNSLGWIITLFMSLAAGAVVVSMIW